jgi:limonene-1,2-epoxide hydrolase
MRFASPIPSAHTGQVAPRALLAGIVIVITLAGCGGGGGSESDGDPKISGDADPGDVRVIDAWVTALRRGDVDAAARYFAIPSVAENGPLLLNIKSIEDARRFNESLPCGARLVRAETQGQLTTATFRLTERPGPGTCGPGTGSAAKTSFVIRDGKIVEWRRVGAGGGGQRPPSQSA